MTGEGNEIRDIKLKNRQTAKNGKRNEVKALSRK